MKWTLVSVVVVTAVFFFAMSFNKNYTFYYYPEWNAYYDVRHKHYIYSIDGGKTWDTVTNSSKGIANTLGEKIVLHSASPEIWLENEYHRNQYAGTLNDLVGGFLQTGKDKRIRRKKNTEKDSIDFSKNESDSVRRDSIEEIENWVKETTVREKTVNEQELKQEPDPPKEEEVLPETGDSTEAGTN